MTTTSRVSQPDNAPGDLNALETTLKNATKKPTAPATGDDKNKNDTSTVQKPEWIQDKFWTGDVAESTRKQAEAYAPLSSAYGRMANDLGTQRKITDQILALDKRTNDLDGTPAAHKPPVVNPRDLVDKPTETLDAYWKQREAQLTAQMDQRDALAQQQRAEADFLQKHGDYGTVTSNPKFGDWVHSSPLRRRAAALAAQGNYVVADELLTEYKAVNGKAPDPSGDPNRGNLTAAETEAARKASLETAAQAGGGGGSGKGPVYRRADLIQLKMEKPHVYSDPAFQAEILRAYAEGRVK